jgi:hypothetical protein
MQLKLKHIGLSLLAGKAVPVCSVSPAQTAHPTSAQATARQGKKPTNENTQQ